MYIDQNLLNMENYNLLNNKLLLTQVGNNVQMLENRNPEDGNFMENSENMQYIPTVDLVIITNSEKALIENKSGFIDKHTIISKILSDDVFYLEDSFKDIHIFITPENTFIFKGHGVETKLISKNEFRNT